MTHYKGPQQVAKRREALEICIDGLEDDDTHLSRSSSPLSLARVLVPDASPSSIPVYRPSLARRLARLENQLDLPYRERHLCDGSLTEAPIVTLSAIRIRVVQPGGDGEDDDDDHDDSPGGNGWGGGAGRKKAFEGATTWGAKSAWMGRDVGEVGVEQWVLEQWEDKGWKGCVVLGLPLCRSSRRS
jgi:Fanconi-associated nuclease 1